MASWPRLCWGGMLGGVPWGKEGLTPQGPGHRAPGTDPCADPMGLCNGRGPTRRPSPGPAGHPPSDPQGRVVQQDADDVEQAGQQLQGEVEQPDPQACGGRDAGHGSRTGRGPSPHSSLRTGCPASTDSVALLGWPLTGCTPSRLTWYRGLPEPPAPVAGVGGATDRLTDQDPRAPLHPILHPRGPSSCWDAGGGYPRREGGATRRGQGAPRGEGAEAVPPGCQGRRVPTGWNAVRAGGEGRSRRPCPHPEGPTHWIFGF